MWILLFMIRDSLKIEVSIKFRILILNIYLKNGKIFFIYNDINKSEPFKRVKLYQL